jgi:hypothetical protein
VPPAADHRELLRLARLADEAGLDLIGIQDHPEQAGYLFWPKGEVEPQLRRFAEEVAPAVREAVGRARTK